MRLKQIDLIRYGKFTNQSLQFAYATNDFHVIVGPNEAGKSTVRTAISELLFGMKLQSPLGFLHEISELRLGGVLESGNTEIAFQRARGRSSLRTPGDDKLPDDHLAAVLDGVSKEFFEQMFGLDHERLVEGGKSILNASDKLGQVLFESAAGISSLGPVRDAFESRLKEIWTPKGSSSEFAVATASFNEAVHELKGAQVRTRDWVERRDALESVQQDIANTRVEHVQLETLRSKLERVRRMAPILQELTLKETALADLGDVIAFPEAAAADLRKAQADIAANTMVLEDRKADLRAKEVERQLHKADGRVLAMASDIEALETLRGACANHHRDIPLRAAEAERFMDAAASAASQLGWPTEEESLRAALPKALALKTITNLLRSHGALHQALVSNKEAQEEKSLEVSQLKEQLDDLPVAEIPEDLRAAHSAAQSFKNSASQVMTLSRAVETAKRALQASLEGLGRYKIPVSELQALNLPSPTRLNALQKKEIERESAVESARQGAEDAQEVVDRLLLQVKHFTENTKVTTGVDVQAARSQRDSAWTEIKSGTVALDAGAPLVDSAIRLADELVDAQLGSTQDAASLQALRQQLEIAQSDLKRKQQTLGLRQEDLRTFNTEWEAITAEAGLVGMPMAEFGNWFTHRDTVLSAHGDLERQKTEFEEFQSACEATRTVLLVALQAVGLGAEADSLPTLVVTADSFLKKIERNAAKRETLQNQMSVAARMLKLAEAKVSTAQAEFDEWDLQWKQATKDANLGTRSASLAQVESAVDLVDQISSNLAAAVDPRSRVHAMQDDLSKLEADAHRIAAALDPELLALGNWFEVARKLLTRLSAATDAAKEISRADAAIQLAKEKVLDAEASVSGAQGRVQPLLHIAGTLTIEDALPLVEQSDRYQELLKDVEKARESLIRDGDGLSKESIQEEVAQHEIRVVPALLENTKHDLAAINEKMNLLMQTQVTVLQAFDTINGQANAALAEAKRQEALSAMGDAAEQYIEAATASRLLKWATDCYRDQKQGPMLKRAGEIFSGLTLGEFTKLTVDTEITPPALYAKRSNGRAVEVIGLSEGTRDQLFLALRIAAIELQVKNKAAMPFIADDLFINFDDARAKAGLQALRDLSTKIQVVFLTHHDHLLAMVKEVFGATVNIVELQSTSTVT